MKHHPTRNIWKIGVLASLTCVTACASSPLPTVGPTSSSAVASCPAPVGGKPGTPPPLLDESPAPGVHHIALQAPRLRDVQGAIDSLNRTYPPELKEQGIGGTTSVWFLIDAAGSTQGVAVARTSGNEKLDQAALEAGKAFSFEGSDNPCTPMMWVAIPVTFTAAGH